MKFKTILIFLSISCHLVGLIQANGQSSVLDSSLTKKIIVSGFCLCQTTLSDLNKLSDDFKPIEVEEMDLGKKCIAQDSRYENGKGYFSSAFPGMVFQKDPNTQQISKIRLTKNFNGELPDGTPIKLQNLKLKDVFDIYPKLKESWGSRGCSEYWTFANDTLFFYVKIDTAKKPQFPIDEAYYYDKPIEAIDILISCYGIPEKADHKDDPNDPVFFIDSIIVLRAELQKYQPTEIAVVTVYKQNRAMELLGERGKYGAIYIETKKFARNKYWNYFKSKSTAYQKVALSPDRDGELVYILNGKVLKTNFEGDLSLIDDQRFIGLSIIDKQRLLVDYNISDKLFGVIIKTKPKPKEE